MVHFTLPRPAHRPATLLLHARTHYPIFPPSRLQVCHLLVGAAEGPGKAAAAAAWCF